MVCRENPLRSAVMGLIKSRSSSNGDGIFHDAEVQSSIHELGHELEAMTPMTTEQQIEHVKQVIAQVEADPDLTDEQKYREYSGRAGQTGIVTRMRAEIDALKTGKDRHGNPIEGTAKENKPHNMAAVMKLGQILASRQAAKTNFLEMNARHRGLGMEEAKAEWKGLMNRKGDFSNISLTDTFRENIGGGTEKKGDTRPESLRQTLSLAGISARDQDEIGQSGRARAAMAVMEQRRLSALGSQKRKPAMSDDFCTVRTFQDRNAVDGTIRCSRCGQFGHEQPCPNEVLVAQKDELAARSTQLDQMRDAARWQSVIDAPDAQLEELVGRLYPGHTVGSLRKDGQDRIDELCPDGIPSEREIARKQKEIDQESAIIRSELDNAGGSVSWIKEARYNPYNGVLQITPHPYTRKDGTVTPPTPFRRRISPETWGELTDGTDSFGKRVHALGLAARNPDESYKFENAADAAAAGTLTQCPTCGQFASMNSAHRCPVVGGPSEDVPARNAAQQTAYRQALRETTDKIPPRARTVKNQVQTAGRKRMAYVDDQGRRVEGSLRMGNAAAVENSTADNVSITPVGVGADLPDANVNGQVRVWAENGKRYITPFDDRGKPLLDCSCAAFARNRTCSHVRAVTNIVGRNYNAAPGADLRPNGNPEATNGASLDAPITASARVDFATLAERRQNRDGEFLASVERRSFATTLMRTPVAMAPRNEDDQPIDEPTTWTRSEGATRQDGSAAARVSDVDLNDARAVQHRLRKVLSGRGSRRSYSVLTDPNGGITVGIQRSARGKATAATQERDLKDLLGLNANANISNGYYVPPTGSARYEVLDRAYGDDKRIQQSRWLMDPTQSDLAANRRQRVAAEHKY